MESHISCYAYPPAQNLPDNEHRFKVCRSVGEECQLEEDLKKILAKNPSPVAYDGFEPSGRMHIAQGVMKKLNVDKLTSQGFTYIFWVADWFAFLNHKMGGDLAKIKVVGQYFIEVWKALGMNMDRVKFLWCSEEMKNRGEEYWGLVLDISTKFSLTRVKRCSTIMGRSDAGLSASQILYPCMQAADIFFMEVDVCQLGVDQRKVNMLAREYAQKLKKTKKMPAILSHHMLLGLKKGQGKMSKSDPESAIFMEDTTEDITKKITKAYCPPKEVYEVEKILVNPCLDYFRVVFQVISPIKFKQAKGEELEFTEYLQLESALVEQKVTLEDLKTNLAFYLNELVKDTRDKLTALTSKLTRKTFTVLNPEGISLKKGVEKIGKSEPEATIFIEDSEEEIKTKIEKSFCPAKAFYEKKKFVNPCMDYFKNIIFESFKTIEFKREEQYGGNLTLNSYAELEEKFMEGTIDPGDVKSNLINYLDQLIKPVREHFINDPHAKDLLEKVIQFRKL